MLNLRFLVAIRVFRVMGLMAPAGVGRTGSPDSKKAYPIAPFIHNFAGAPIRHSRAEPYMLDDAFDGIVQHSAAQQ